MIYLKSLIKRTTDNPEIIKYIRNIESDKEGLDYLISKGFNFKDIITQMEEFFGFKYINLNEYKITEDVLNSFDDKSLKNHNVIPFQKDTKNKLYYFAINDITNTKIRNKIEIICKDIGYQAVFNFAFEYEIVNKYKEIELGKISEKNLEVTETFNAQAFVEDTINKAIEEKASDIHIENLEEGLQLRYRIDGILTGKKVFPFDKNIISNIIVVIKNMSGLDISEKRRAQDGRIDAYEYKNQLYDLRVSTVNTVLGEKITMRLFNKNSKVLTFKELGLSHEDIEKIKRMLKHKNGIVYLAGATGSGKTTTLYTMIDYLNSDEVNIYTIENPVEKTIKNINQIQINELAGINYVNTLKALLRQDPDIIVVGEIRDSEEADITLRVSLTGHLVMTTIHANTALDSISRLLDMDIDPYVMGTSSLGFMSQRLVRTLCPYCKRKVKKLPPNEKTWLDIKVKENNMKDVDINSFYEPVGCIHCNNGYKGRIAVAEIVEVSDKMKKLISQKAGITEIKKEAILSGYKSLTQRGIEKVVEGKTSLEEIMKQTI